MKLSLAFAAVLLAVAPLSIRAQTVLPAPPLMNFQGHLARPDGTSVNNGTYSVLFSLYDMPTGGALKWSETDSVTVRNGSFAVLLGNVTALTDATFSGSLWLQIKVGSDLPLTPRQPIVTVAYAFKADTVPDGSVATVKIANGAITAAKLAPGVAFSGSAAGGDLTGTYPNPLLATLETSLAKVSGGAMTSSGGRIGIGTPLPGANALYVLNPSTVNVTQSWFAPNKGSNYSHSQFGATGDWYLRSSKATGKVVLQDSGGNVGIGTSNPAATLDVEDNGSGYGLYANSNSGIGAFVQGVTYGLSAYGVGGPGISTGSLSDVGLEGYSNSSHGIHGIGHADNVAGVLGEDYAALGTGVSGHGGANGVFGANSNATSALPSAGGFAGVVGYGGGTGVIGYSTLGFGTGVIGEANGFGANGVYGTSSSNFGTGVRGENHGANGVGVQGTHSLTSNYGILGDSADGVLGVASSNGGTGVFGSSANGNGVIGASASNTGIGVKGNSNSAYGYGVQGTHIASGNTGILGSPGYGVYGASNSSTGVYGYSNSNTSAVGAGVYGVNPNYNGYAIFANGTASGTTAWIQSSDARYKTNVVTLNNALEDILLLRGVNFDWKRDEFKDKNFAAGHQIGFIAQEVEKVLPDVVFTDDKGYKSVAYSTVIPVLVEAVKTLKTQLDDKQKQIDELKRQNAEITDLKKRLAAVLELLKPKQMTREADAPRQK